jgi:hypothetical protein
MAPITAAVNTKGKKCIMDMPLTRKVQAAVSLVAHPELAPKELAPKDANPFIRDLESHVHLAKASDLAQVFLNQL